MCHGVPVSNLFAPVRLLRPFVLVTVAPLILSQPAPHFPVCGLSAHRRCWGTVNDALRTSLVMSYGSRNDITRLPKPIKGRVRIANLFFWPSPSSQKCHNRLPDPDCDKLPGPVRVSLMVSIANKAILYSFILP